jgi:basic amino acid/polyamine antiporter, APA family
MSDIKDPSSPKSPPKHPHQLDRVLGPWVASAIVIGTVIGSGVFKKPAVIAQVLPFFGVAMLVWMLGGMLGLMGALTYAEIAVLYPKAGGNYVFLREAYGRLASFLYGWVDFGIIRSASVAALATIFTESLHEVLTNHALQNTLGLHGPVLGNWVQRLVTISIIVILAAVNVRGVRWGGGLQLAITLVKVGSLIGIIALPLFVILFGSVREGTTLPSSKNLLPIWPESWDQVTGSALSKALLGVIWAYHGWMNIAPIAEEVRAPQRNIPLALLAGIGTIITLYLGANVAYALTIPVETMAKSQVVVATFGLKLLGSLGSAAASAALLCSVFGALNGNLLVGPRLLYAMGLDGLAPRWLGDTHPRFHTPAYAIGLLALWSSLLVLGAAALTTFGIRPADRNHFDMLTDFAMFGAVIFETMAVLSIFVFRWRRPTADRPYRCLGYPLVPALYVVVPAFIIWKQLTTPGDQQEAFIAVGFIAVGAVVYVLFGLYRTPSPVPATDAT